MDDEPIDDLYDLVLAEVEEPLLRLLLVHTGQNQSRTAAMLGMNRGTLRKNLENTNCFKTRALKHITERI